MVAMAKLTKVLPTSSVEKSTALSARQRAMRASAFGLRARMRERWEPVSEKSTVSALEKNAERTTSATKTATTTTAGTTSAPRPPQP